MEIKGMNFGWLYKAEFRDAFIREDYDDSDFMDVDIPHSNVELPFNNFDEKSYQFESCYRKHFRIEGVSPNECVFIKFNGMMACGRVYLNGVYLGQHKSGYTPWRIDISKQIKEENCLVVHLDSRERSDMPPFGFVIDYLTYGGIYREVEIQRTHEIHVRDILIKPKDVLRDTYLQIELNFSKCGEKVCVVMKLEEERQSFDIVTSENNSIKWQIEKKELWDLENPRLYDLKVEIFYNGEPIDERWERIGFREAVFREGGFFLNGRKIKLIGLNRHQSYPYVGYAMPKSAQVKDADILKFELGVNIVRASHYPQSIHFLNRCDEIGLLVFEEIPGWQHIGDESWKEESLSDLRRMIFRDINHPSIIIWGTRINESRDDDEFYERTYNLAKEIDETRQVGGVRCIKNSNLIEDVYTYNDFVFRGKNIPLEKKRSVTKMKKPYLVTEFNGHMFPTKKFDNEGRRTEHSIRHMKVINRMMGDNQISGAIGWCMFDYNTHKDFGSGDGICYHGVLDMFRIPKTAAFFYASQSDEKTIMHVTSEMNIGEYSSSLIKDIYIYTNCDYVELYRGGNFVKKFYPDNKNFPNLKHPPISVDDLVGDAIEKNERFSSVDAEIVKKILNRVSRDGENIGIIDKIKWIYILRKYKMNRLDVEDLYTKYFGGWGSEGGCYTFKGIKDGEIKTVVKKGKYYSVKLIMNIDKETLEERDTYDVTRVILRLVDENENDIVYANDTLRISTEGPIKVIGPQIISLIGGSLGFWIRSIGESGRGKITIKSERFNIIEKDITVCKY